MTRHKPADAARGLRTMPDLCVLLLGSQQDPEGGETHTDRMLMRDTVEG